MAGVYTPTITFFPTGTYTITSAKGTPYFMIQNSLGSYQYAVYYIYYQSLGIQQLLQGLSFRSYDVNGDRRNFINTTTVDPYQYQNSLFLKPIRNDVVLDGKTSITFKLLPSEEVNFTFYVIESKFSMFLKEPSFFEDYFFQQQQQEFHNGFVE
jgi:hypothetical protein